MVTESYHVIRYVSPLWTRILRSESISPAKAFLFAVSFDAFTIFKRHQQSFRFCTVHTSPPLLTALFEHGIQLASSQLILMVDIVLERLDLVHGEMDHIAIERYAQNDRESVHDSEKREENDILKGDWKKSGLEMWKTQVMIVERKMIQLEVLKGNLETTSLLDVSQLFVMGNESKLRRWCRVRQNHSRGWFGNLWTCARVSG